MGIFRKSPDESPKQELLQALEFATNFSRNFENDPGKTLAWLAASAPDPHEATARMLAFLILDEVISLEQLAVLGIDPGEFRKLIENLQTENPRETLSYETQVIHAIVAYDQQIDELLTDAGVNYGPEERSAFRAELAGFAAANEITDLKLAYRLMKAEGHDPLKHVARQTPSAGYI